MFLVSYIVYLFAYRLLGYRKKVVRRNLAMSFPEKSEKERRKLERQFYHRLSDMLVEGVWSCFASPKWLMRHCHVTNRELVNRYYEQGKSVVLMSAHYNNWEYLAVTLNMQFFHHGIGVAKPLNNKVLNPWLLRRRTRYGMEVAFVNSLRGVISYYDRHHVPCTLLMLGDQSPARGVKAYWTTFLNQDTAFLCGTEFFARKFDYPVLYFRVDRGKRGHYNITFSVLSEHPNEEPKNGIIERYARKLEQDILEHPECWLWSHRRWKRKKSTEENNK